MKKYRHAVLCATLTVAAVLTLAGCAGKEKAPKRDEFLDKWRAVAKESRAYLPKDRQVAEEQRPPAPPPESAPQPAAEIEKPLPTQPITLEIRNTDIGVLLRALARAVDQNIIINETVKGQVNINVRETPWDQVFRAVLKTYGLSYGWEGDIIHIITQEDQDKNLKQLETEQLIKAKIKEIEMVEPLMTRIVRLDYANANNLKSNLEQFLSEKAEDVPLGSVMVDPDNNALIIQAIRSDIERMLPIIDDLDRPTPQVLIEANIVEATQDAARELGIQWGGLYHNTSDGDNWWITPGQNASGTLGSSVDQAVDPSSGLVSNFPAAVKSDASFTLGFLSQKTGEYLLNIQLSALQEDGKVNILSSPSITTLDNQKAVIKSGQEVPYQTVEDGEVKIEFKEAVLELEVTPHVIDDRALKLEILTRKNDLDFTIAVQGQPGINKREAQTNILLLDGQTTVIGGLAQERVDASTAGVPVFKDVPGLGWLFKSKSDNNEMDELMIFITPHILHEKAGWAVEP